MHENNKNYNFRQLIDVLIIRQSLTLYNLAKQSLLLTSLLIAPQNLLKKKLDHVFMCARAVSKLHCD